MLTFELVILEDCTPKKHPAISNKSTFHKIHNHADWSNQHWGDHLKDFPESNKVNPTDYNDYNILFPDLSNYLQHIHHISNPIKRIT